MSANFVLYMHNTHMHAYIQNTYILIYILTQEVNPLSAFTKKTTIKSKKMKGEKPKPDNLVCEERHLIQPNIEDTVNKQCMNMLLLLF